MIDEKTSIPLIRTKLHKPPVAGDHLHRQRLLDRLNQRLHRPLTLVSAPAGYGKSTLVSCWLEACDIPAAWVSLDKHDNDLQQFLSYFVAAVQTISQDACRTTQIMLNAADMPPVSILSANLINELDQLDNTFILVLDDYHFIVETAVHDFMNDLLTHPPKSMHLVLATRRDPPLPLPTLRARSRMTEIRVQDLRFSSTETAVFLRQSLKAKVDDSTAAVLGKRTEGWVTGLRLAALSLRHRTDLDRIMTDLPEDNRYVMDYVAEEVIAQQSPDMQKYLLTTAALDRFNASLCDAICLTSEEQATCQITGRDFIKNLEKSNLFIVPLDDQHHWFRYHHLFQKLLQRQLKRRFSPDDIATLHKKAGAWFAGEGLLDEAFHHIVSAGEIEEVVRLVAQHRHSIMNQEQWHLLDRFLGQLPADRVENELDLLTLKAWSCENRSRLHEMATALDRINTVMASSPGIISEDSSLQGEIEALTAAQYYFASDGARAVTHAKQALEKIDSEAYSVRGFDELVLAFGYQMTGSLKSAYKILQKDLDGTVYHGTTYRYRLLTGLCFVQWMASDLNGLYYSAAHYLKLTHDSNLPETVSFAHYFMGIALYQRNEPAEAIKHLNIVMKSRYFSNTMTFIHSAFILALAYQALKRSDEARQTAELVITHCAEIDNIPLMEVAQAFMAELDLRQGRIAAAGQFAQTFEPQPFTPAYRYYVPQLTMAKVLIAAGTQENYRKAQDLLEQLHDYYKAIHNTRCQIEVTALQALLYNALGKEPESLDKLESAISLAEPGGFIRLFVDLGPELADLLVRLATKKGTTKYIGQLMTALKNEKGATVQSGFINQTTTPLPSINQTLEDPLTNREFEVLSLLAQRLRNKEIAEKLFISPETVKRHTINVYGKLNVHSRREAVDKANALGILSR